MKNNKSGNLQVNTDSRRVTENTIMVVDDSKFARNVLSDILRNNGFQVVAEAKNGLEAVELTKELRPEYIFLDVEMPVLDGLGAIPRILEIEPKTHIIMCTAMGQKNVIVEAAKAGAKDYVIKPYKKENILRVLNIIMESKKNGKRKEESEHEGGSEKVQETAEEAMTAIKTQKTEESMKETKASDEKNEHESEIIYTADSNKEEFEAIQEASGKENTQAIEKPEEDLERIEAAADTAILDTRQTADAVTLESKTAEDTADLEEKKIYQSPPIEEAIPTDNQDAAVAEEEAADSAITDDMEKMKEPPADEDKSMAKAIGATMQETMPKADTGMQEKIPEADGAGMQEKVPEVSEADDTAMHTEMSEADEAQMLLEVLQAKKDPELIAYLEEIEKKDYGREIAYPDVKIIRRHLVDINMADGNESPDTTMEYFYFSYLWMDRLDFSRKVNTSNPITARRLFFTSVIATQDNKDALKKKDEENDSQLSGLANAFLHSEQRLQSREVTVSECAEGKRILSGAILMGGRISGNDISITDLLEISASRKVNHSVIRKDILSKAIARLVSEKADRRL